MLFVVGAHYDIVPPTMAGANDNTSGTAVVLALADALSGRSLPFTVRFIAFGAEELGLYGSRNYVSALGDAELGQVKAMLNLDPVGTGAWIGVAGNDELMALALEMAKGLGVEARISPLPPGASSRPQIFSRTRACQRLSSTPPMSPGSTRPTTAWSSCIPKPWALLS